MKSKLRIIIVAVLAVAIFAISYLVSAWLAPAPAPVETAGPAEQAETAPGDEEATSQGVSLSMKERELDELVREVRGKIEECKKRQGELDKQEARIRQAGEELRNQAKELEAMRVELVAPLTRIRETMAELENTRIRIRSSEQVNLKRIATVCEKMDSASGGEMLARMCTAQQEDDAVKILRYMSERSAGKLLSEMGDKELAARLCSKLKRVEEES